jgi:prolyl-tRNA editing enzyme YbaK/EbsC (Cys-tRNA(Pro) deacylase)
MIPQTILDHLETNRVAFRHRYHRPAVSGQEVAAALEITGWQVGKTVLVDVDGVPWMAVLPAPAEVTLYGMPVVLDTRLPAEPSIVVRAGSHTECVELATSDTSESADVLEIRIY